jgi:hypothetical protein
MEHWFDDLSRAAAGGLSRRALLRRLGAGLAGGALAALLPAAARAQFTDTASAGNGGVATASASGGAVAMDDVDAGGQAGNAIGVGDLSTEGTSAGVSPAAAAGAFNQLPPIVVPAVPDCPTGTTACGVAGCCPSGTVCTDRGCVRGRRRPK